ncbi:MAG: hypothetical protein PHZ03_01430 [Syntrophomonas sp.]|nr:hypothetical protein [Syntrophomonas sp.]
MYKNIGKTLFGFKPKDVINEMERIDSEHQARIGKLQAKIAQAKEELKKTEARLPELQKQLDHQLSKERQIAEVMLTAQINAQRIEDQAREKAEIVLLKAEEELRRKKQELDFLQMKVNRFKEEFGETLDNYKKSLEQIKESADDIFFAPTLITNDKMVVKSKIQDISS